MDENLDLQPLLKTRGAAGMSAHHIGDTLAGLAVAIVLTAFGLILAGALARVLFEFLRLGWKAASALL